MAGEQLGGRARLYVFGVPTTNLEFSYTEQELDEIRSGRLPDSLHTRLVSRRTTVMSRSMRVWVPLFLLFVLISAIVATTAENGRVAVPLLLLGSFAVFAAIFFVPIWLNFVRPSKNRALKVQTLRAYKSTTGFSVRFGQTAMTGKSWSMDKTAFGLIKGDVLYNVYSVADMLVFLEEV